MKKIIKEISKEWIHNPRVKEISVSWKGVQETVRPELHIIFYSKIIVCPVCEGSTNRKGSTFVPCQVCGGRGVLET